MKKEGFFSIEKPKDDFVAKKEKVLDFLHREAMGKVGLGVYKNEGQLDENIRDIVVLMNRLPFLYTTQACGGHTITRESIKASYPDTDEKFLQLPSENLARYQSGGVHFETNKNAESQKFIENLKFLVSQFEGVNLFDPISGINEEYRELPYILEFGKSSGRKCISIQEAREVEIKREEFKKAFKKLIEESLQAK